MSAAATNHSRLTSLDQFRGYTVAGMFLVNFLAPFAAIHHLLKHNETYFSYADSIMPSFMFVVGFSFRLTSLRRLRNAANGRTTWHYVRRCLVLVLLGMMIYGFTGRIDRWFRIHEMPGELQAKRETQSPAIDLEEQYLPQAIEQLRSWHALSWPRKLVIHWRILAAKLLKSEIWGTLTIIGVTQLAVLPWIGCRFGTRFLVLVVYGLAHAFLAYWFNWDFVYGIDGNWMSQLWMTGQDRSWDGGFFGFLGWGVAMLAGTLAYDLVAGAATHAIAARRMLLWGAAFMAVGYAMSCLTRLYDLNDSELAALRVQHLRQDAEKSWLENRIQSHQKRLRFLLSQVSNESSETRLAEIERLEASIMVLEDRRGRFPNLQLAKSPVLPSWERLRGRPLCGLLAELPFVAPPQDDPLVDPPPRIEHRQRNYWMLGKRMPNLTFMTFSSGFAFAAYGLFVVICDVGGLNIGLFRTFGTNALAAYFVHGAVGLILTLSVPHDVSLWPCLACFAIAFLATYLTVRALEQRGVYWTL